MSFKTWQFSRCCFAKKSKLQKLIPYYLRSDGNTFNWTRTASDWDFWNMCGTTTPLELKANCELHPFETPLIDLTQIMTLQLELARSILNYVNTPRLDLCSFSPLFFDLL